MLTDNEYGWYVGRGTPRIDENAQNFSSLWYMLFSQLSREKTDVAQQLSVQLVFVCLWFDYGYDIHVLKVNYAMYFPSYLSSITSDPLPSCVDCWFKGVSFMQELQTHKVRQMENITPIPIGIHNLSWMSAETVNVHRKFQKY